MQDAYAGDIGDFGKIALLNALARSDLRLGIAWYLNPATENGGDGKFTEYPEIEACDPTLYKKLVSLCQHGRRSVAELERGEFFPDGTLYFRDQVPSPARPCFSAAARDAQRRKREEWFDNALHALSPADLVFLDPDNGLATARVSKHTRSSVKYSFPDEVRALIARGCSVVLYQHQNRKGLKQQISDLWAEFDGAAHGTPWALEFHRRSVRIYLVIPSTADDGRILRERSGDFCKGRWGDRGTFRLSLG